MNAPVKRDARGFFLPGQSGNPAGRPRVVEEIRDLARQHAPAALAKIAELIGSNDPKVAFAASVEILNRVYGKPVQSIESDVRQFDMGALYVRALEAVNNDRGGVIVDITPRDHSAAADTVSNAIPPPDQPGGATNPVAGQFPGGGCVARQSR